MEKYNVYICDIDCTAIKQIASDVSRDMATIAEEKAFDTLDETDFVCTVEVGSERDTELTNDINKL